MPDYETVFLESMNLKHFNCLSGFYWEHFHSSVLGAIWLSWALVNKPLPSPCMLLRALFSLSSSYSSQLRWSALGFELCAATVPWFICCLIAFIWYFGKPFSIYPTFINQLLYIWLFWNAKIRKIKSYVPLDKELKFSSGKCHLNAVDSMADTVFTFCVQGLSE